MVNDRGLERPGLGVERLNASWAVLRLRSRVVYLRSCGAEGQVRAPEGVFHADFVGVALHRSFFEENVVEVVF